MESESASPFDKSAEWSWIVFSTDEKSSNGFSPGNVRLFFSKLALHIPPKYASSDSSQLNVELGSLV